MLAGLALAAAIDFTPIERAADELMKTTKTPGMGVAVVQDGNVVYAQGFGVASVNRATPVTSDTLFQIGSLTKVFTAATVLSMHLDLDAPVSRYVNRLDPSIGRLTLRQLLTHTAGLKDEPAEYGSHEDRALGDYARTWTRDYAILPPGTVFSYSNGGYALAGLAAEQTARKPFADLVAERIFAPLGMTQTTFRPTVAMTYPLARGHKGARGEVPAIVRPMADDTRFYPAGFIYTTANDLARFAAALMSDGLDPGILNELLKPRVDVANELEPASYGYGLFIETYHGIPTIWHAGDMPGFSAMLRILPEQHAAIVALANRQGVRLDPMVDALFETLHVTPTERAKAIATPIAMTPQEMQSYTGHYTNRFDVDVFVRDGKLWIKRPDGEHQLEKIGRNRFTTDATRAFRPNEIEIEPGYLSMWVWSFAKASGAPPPPAARLDSNWAGITVSDIDQSIRWYIDVLGFSIETPPSRPKPDIGFAVLRHGGYRLELIERKNAKPRPEPGMVRGVFKIGFRVENLTAFAESLRAKGVKITNSTPMYFLATDPDGNVLQFFQSE